MARLSQLEIATMMAMRTYGWGHHMTTWGGRQTPKTNSRTYLFLGDGTGNFRDFSESGLLETNSTALSATWVDYDNDGDLDLYQSNYGITSSLLQIRLI